LTPPAIGPGGAIRRSTTIRCREEVSTYPKAADLGLRCTVVFDRGEANFTENTVNAKFAG
jgi:hypothetical protein